MKPAYDYSKIQNRAKTQDEKFYDPFLEFTDPATLDLSSCPSFTPTRIAYEDDINVPLSGVNDSSREKQLQDMLNTDPTILEELRTKPAYGSNKRDARTADEEKLIKHYDDLAGHSSFHFGINNGDYTVWCNWERGGWSCKAYSDDNKPYENGHFKPTYGDGTPVRRDDKEGVMSACTKHYSPKALWRQLTNLEQRTVSYVASGGRDGDLQNAANEYVAHALDIYSEDERAEKLADPRFIQLAEEANWFAFIHGKVSLTEEDIQTISDILGDRTATINSLLACYEIFEKEQEKSFRGQSRLFNPPAYEPEPEKAPTYEEIDELSTSEITELREKAIREKLRQRSAQPAY